jgi:hypothetical protein
MGMFFGLVMTWFLVWGLYRFASSRTARATFFRETYKTLRSPRELLFVLWAFTGAGAGLVFFWGVLAPVFGRIKVGATLELWSTAGLVALLWFASLVAYLSVKEYRDVRRRRRALAGAAREG